MRKRKIRRTLRGALLPLFLCGSLGLASLGHAAAGEAGTVRGVVTDEEGNPVAGAHVLLHMDHWSTTVETDVYGAFDFGNVSGARPEIHIAAPGYRAEARPVEADLQEAGAELDVQLSPYSAPEAGDWLAVSQTSKHIALLASDGTVWTALWRDGWNSRGQLGDGTTVDRYGLMQVPGLSNVVDLAAGEDFTLALRSDGSVWGWGANDRGQLGDVSGIDRLRPEPVPLPADIVAIAAGKEHGLALSSDGGVWSWGANSFGQLGREAGQSAEDALPAAIPGLSGAEAIVSGDYHSAALIGGTVYTWGLNEWGQLGTGVGDYFVPEPQAATNLNGVTAIASADDSMLAYDGALVWGWGMGEDGQLAPGTYYANEPVEIAELGGVAKLAAGDHHSAALTEAGDVYVWGGNGNGQLGLGSDWWSAQTPERVAYVDDIVDISAGERMMLAQRADGSVWFWGDPGGFDFLDETGDRYSPYLFAPSGEELMRPAVLSGTVTDGFGAPLAGASVRATLSDPRYPYAGGELSAAADEDGTYELALPPYEFAIEFFMDGYRPESIPGTVVFGAGESHVRDAALYALSGGGHASIGNAMFFDSDLRPGYVGGALRWDVEGEGAAAYDIVFADASGRTIGAAGAVTGYGPGAYRFYLPADTVKPQEAEFLAILPSGGAPAFFVPLADAASSMDVVRHVREVGDADGDGFALNDVRTLLRSEVDIDGDGVFGRGDVTILLNAISPRSFD